MDWNVARDGKSQSTHQTDRSSTSSTPSTVEMDAKAAAKDAFVFSVSDSSDHQDDTINIQNDSQSDDEMSDFSLNFSDDEETKGLMIEKKSFDDIKLHFANTFSIPK